MTVRSVPVISNTTAAAIACAANATMTASFTISRQENNYERNPKIRPHKTARRIQTHGSHLPRRDSAGQGRRVTDNKILRQNLPVNTDMEDLHHALSNKITEAPRALSHRRGGRQRRRTS